MKRGRNTALALPPEVLAERLAQGAAALQVPLDARAPGQLLDYLALLQKWNAVYNLTAIRDPAEMLVAHVLDSLAILPLLLRLGVRHILDVGSGAGLPGIPLAIAKPDWRVDLVDAVQKKVAFQTQVKAQLQLANLHCHHGRIEVLTLPEKPDCIVSRAFASLADMAAGAGHLLAAGGVMVAMKGQRPDVEIAALPSAWAVREIADLAVPGLAAERCAVVLQPIAAGASA